MKLTNRNDWGMDSILSVFVHFDINCEKISFIYTVMSNLYLKNYLWDDYMINNKIIVVLSLIVCSYSFVYGKKTMGPRTANTGTLLENIDRRLQNAAARGKLKKVESLLKRGANVNSQDGVGFSPLHLAAMNEERETVEILLKNGADVNSKNDDDETPLFLVADKNNQNIIDLLCVAGADVTIKNKFGVTVLHKASEQFNVSILKLFFEKGASQFVNACSRSHMSPLHYATLHDNEEAVLFLMENGADLTNECNSESIAASPYAMALANGKFKAAKILKWYDSQKWYHRRKTEENFRTE